MQCTQAGNACLLSCIVLWQEDACTAPADMCWHVQQAEAAANAQQNEAFEIDQWILDFANLFREQLNIEPDKHLDLTNMGWDKLQSALDSAVQSDKAPAIFDAAADKFQEVSAHGELTFSFLSICPGQMAAGELSGDVSCSVRRLRNPGGTTE